RLRRCRRVESRAPGERTSCDHPAGPARRQRHGVRGGERARRPVGGQGVMTQPWLFVVGIGEDGLDGLSSTARALVDAAEILIGGTRHLAMLPEDGRPRHPWPSPLSRLVAAIEGWRGRRV